MTISPSFRRRRLLLHVRAAGLGGQFDRGGDRVPGTGSATPSAAADREPGHAPGQVPTTVSVKTVEHGNSRPHFEVHDYKGLVLSSWSRDTAVAAAKRRKAALIALNTRRRKAAG